uniref:Uncharacterized protein n=1 Tax=Clastoptera arizonana TaxID=38151 RepID=A0A1B6DHT3_9HEMI
MKFLNFFYSKPIEEPQTWPQYFLDKISTSYNNSTNVLSYYFSALYYGWDSTSTFTVTIFSSTILICALIAFFYSYTILSKLKQTKEIIMNLVRSQQLGFKNQTKIEEIADMSAKLNEDVNMAVYMYEKRRKGIEKSNETKEFGDLVFDQDLELYSKLQAQPCDKDGLEILNVEECDKNLHRFKNQFQKKSPNFTLEHTSLKLGEQSGISLEECLNHKNGTFEFVLDTPVEVIKVTNDTTINALDNEESREHRTENVYNKFHFTDVTKLDKHRRVTRRNKSLKR